MSDPSTSSSVQRSSTLHLPLSRRDLAMHYFPSPTVKSSVRRLARWLGSDPTLLDELKAVGYYAGKHWFNREELDVFIKYFGK